TQVLAAIRAANTNVPGGAIEIDSRRVNIRTSGNYETPEEVLDTAVFGDGAHIVRVRDIASVRWAQGPDRHLGRYNGKRAVFITANQKEGQNIFVTRDALHEVLDAIERELPADVTLERGFDQSRNVAKR